MPESQRINKTAIRDIVNFCEASGTFSDLLDTFKKGTRFANDLFVANKMTSGSIAKRTSQLVLVFPVLVSTSLKIDTAIMISKAIERKCVSLLQILFSAINLTDFGDTRDLYDYIKKFHSNLDVSGGNLSLDDFMHVANTIANEGGLDIVDKDAFDMVMEQFKSMNTLAKDYFRESSVNDFVVSRTMYGKTNILLEANPTNPKNIPPLSDDQYQDWLRQQQAQRIDDSIAAARKQRNGVLKDRSNVDVIKNQLQNTDVSKANELQPTAMVINFTTITDGGPINRSGVIGVKAKLYPVESRELIGRLSSKYQDGGLLMNLIKVTTGEKSFFKDLAFAFDKLKRDAVNIAKGSINSKLFSALERRASKNNSKFLKMGDASPITTIVISQSEVETLKNDSHNVINIENPTILTSIMNGYNLMGFVIADDIAGIAKFFFDDGNNTFETITYRSLSKENSGTEDMKQMVNLVNKMTR